ncbi:hypothetical protein [Streptomyces sp. NPDC046862]|uniref:hypothetical protein n=1 Tax=Streptomyces sp. NPDC046862 TaxID=3154603 RepID=UPI003455FCAB
MGRRAFRRRSMGPAYCTALTLDELGPALAAADRVRGARIRDSVPECFAALSSEPALEQVVEMNRAAQR